MLWNKDFLFIHFPKTAGKTMARVFAESWPGPVNAAVPPGTMRDLQDLINSEKVTAEESYGHENLEIALTTLRERGFDVGKLRAIYVAVRNPYDLMVSNYFFMRRRYEAHKDRPNFVLAMHSSFEEYCEQVEMPKIETWFRLSDGSIPNGLRIVRFELLAQELSKMEAEVGVKVCNVPHLNKTERGHYSEYMSTRAEAAIYEKYKALFDMNLYSRESFSK